MRDAHAPPSRPWARPGRAPGAAGSLNLLLALLILSSPVASCGSSPLEDGPTLLRVENATGADLTDVHVFVTPPIELAALSSGEASGYFPVDLAYRYATVTVTAGEATLTLQAIDFVGEVPLGPGRFTYRLGLAEGAPDHLILDFIRDD